MAKYDTRNASFTLPSYSSLEATNQPVSTSNVGNVLPIAAGQKVSVSVESAVPRQVTLSNVGSVPLVVNDGQRDYPFGLRLVSGSTMQIVTSSALWVAAPPTARSNASVAGAVPTLGYVSVSVAK